MELLHMHLAQPAPSLLTLSGEELDAVGGRNDKSTHRMDIPPAVAQLISRLLEKNPEARYQSVQGVETDLTKMSYQLRSSGFIQMTPEELGSRDFAATLGMPKRLYGREGEVKKLEESLRRVCCGGLEAVLISGESGVGKSTLVKELHGPVAQRRGHYFEVKFDQLHPSKPYSALIQVFTEMCDIILTEDEGTLAHKKVLIQQGIRNEGKVLTDVLPNLQLIIGEQPAVPGLGIMESRYRFHDVFCRFAIALAESDSPIVMLIDDLQWADESSLDLISALMSSPEAQHILYIGCFRANEVALTSPLALHLQDIKHKMATVTDIKIGNLGQLCVNNIISDVLDMSMERTKKLANLVQRKTHGNPFFVVYFLKLLCNEGLVRFSHKRLCWQWNIVQIESQTDVTYNVVKVITNEIMRLPLAAQRILRLASCIGNTFDLTTLKQVIGTEDTHLDKNKPTGCLSGDDSRDMPEENWVEQCIVHAETADMITHQRPSRSQGEGRYRFSHDQIHKTLHMLLPEDEQKRVHLDIGRYMLQQASKNNLDERIVDIVNQMNCGVDLVPSEIERIQIARLNLQAAEKASASGAHTSAHDYLNVGIGLLRSDHWKDEYELSLHLCVMATKTCYVMARYDEMEQHSQKVMLNASGLYDKISVYSILISAENHKENFTKSLEIGLGVLSQLGEPLPLWPRSPDVIWGFCKTKWVLWGKTDEMLSMLPLMDNRSTEATVEMLNKLIHAAFAIRPTLSILLSFKMIQLALQHGVAPLSAFAFATYGSLLCGFMGKRKEGYRFGRIALSLQERLKSQQMLAKTFVAVYGFINHWSEHLHLTLEPLRHAHSVGLKMDVEYGHLSGGLYLIHSYFCGKPLNVLLDEMIQFFEIRKQHAGVVPADVYTQAVMNLLGHSQNPIELKGDAFDQNEIQHKFRSSLIFQFNVCFNRLMLSYLFYEYETASDMAEKSRMAMRPVMCMHASCINIFYDGLTSLAMARKTKAVKWRQKALQCIKKIEGYALDSPQNFLHKLKLLQAELAFLDGNDERAVLAYDDAICLAQKEKFINDEALVHERKGIFYLKSDRGVLALTSFSQASQLYLEWGAMAKVKHLRRAHRGIFKELKRHSFRSSSLSQSSLISSTSVSSEIEGDDLDLRSVMKSSTSLSAEIKLPDLLQTLMVIVMENAGAQKAFLLLAENAGKDLFVQASSSIFEDKSIVLQRVPLHLAQEIAQTVVQYVNRTQNHVVLEDAREKNRFSKDPHIKKCAPRSLLCVPIIDRGKSIGVFYMENNSGTAVFTHNRVALLALLTGQIAISIENAMLYENLEQKVSDRTNELKEERDQSECLLLNILPKEIAEELKQDGRVKPKHFDEVTVLFTDFKGFTQISMVLTCGEMVGEIDACFSAFDSIIEKYGVEKIKTIGDAYMCAGGLPTPNVSHPMDVLRAAKDMREWVLNRKVEREAQNHVGFEIRIGVHTGPVIAGVVGTKKFAFDIWGDTVNTASRMESSGEVGKINISSATYEKVKDKISATHRGAVEAKNKGKIDMFFVDELL